jgi:enoyl-CoA hydratase/carnithine racemase
MAVELHLALTAIDARPDVRVLVITGSGDAFSVGADLGGGDIRHPGGGEFELPANPLLPSAMSIPVIAALNGHAAGAGISFSLHCDLRILADSAKVAFAFIRRGIIPEMGMHWLLPRVVGIAKATEMILTGATLTADEALAAGLVHRVVPSGEVLDHAVAAAREIVSTTSPLGSSYAKQLTWRSLGQSFDVAWADERAAFDRCAAHPDAVEGVTSFLERRPPTWTGVRDTSPPAPVPAP